MKTLQCVGAVVFMLALAGCDSAKEPMAKAREAEAAGKLSDAKTLYADVCKTNEKSPFCAVAKQHVEALAAREALAAVAEGNYGKAKEHGAVITDGPAKRVYGALLKNRGMTAWAAFEEANAGTDKAAARVKMVELAQVSSPIADQAKEWLTKNGPGLLLAEIKAACTPTGTGSCSDLGQQMAKSYPSAPEATEAQGLVDAEYKRLYPTLKQAEALLVQRLEVFNWQAKRDLCTKLVDTNQEEEVQACNEAIGIPSDRGDPFNTDFLEKAWKKKLDEIHDPGMIKALEERWGKIAAAGTYDPANLPKPGDKPAEKAAPKK